MKQIATAFGLIWAALMFASGMTANIGMGLVVDLYAKDPVQAGTIWLSRQFVIDGLGGGSEIVGGLWVLLISWAALRAKGLSRALNVLGVVVSAAGPSVCRPGSRRAGRACVWAGHDRLVCVARDRDAAHPP